MEGMRVLNESERLLDYRDLLRFAEQAGAIDRAAARRLSVEAERHPRRAAEVLAQAIAIREALHDVLLASVEDRPVESEALSAVDRWIKSAQADRELRSMPGGGY